MATEHEEYLRTLIDRRFYPLGPHLSPEIVIELKRDIESQLGDYIFMRMFSALSSKDLHTAMEMKMRGYAQEKVQNFVIEHVSDYESFYSDVLDEFKRIYLGGRRAR